MAEPLNPILYEALTRLFGYKPKIVNQGMKFTYQIEVREGREHFRAQGEQYAVCCPDCGDKKYRLYFNHMYGMALENEPRFMGLMTNLAFCQHEQVTKPHYYVKLKEALANPNIRMIVEQRTQAIGFDGAEVEVPPMGKTIPLDQLPSTAQAIHYLVGRGYDPAYLSKTYGACLIESHPDEKIHRMVKSRIGFPFYVDGEIVMWQARLAYDTKEKQQPKWYFPSGCKKVPWGWDVARQFPVVIVTEGILSAVNFGPAAVSIGGKVLTYNSRKMITEHFKYAIVALDSDAGINRDPEKPGGHIDYQKRMLDELNEAGVHSVGIEWVEGDKRDPGDYGPAACMDFLKQSAPDLAPLLSYVR